MPGAFRLLVTSAGEVGVRSEGADRLYRDHSAALRRFAASMTGAGQDVDDLVQESFTRAIQHDVAGFEPRSARTWLMRTCRNAFIDRLRRQAARPEVSVLPSELELRCDLSGHAPDAGIGVAAVTRGLLRLPESQRTAVWLVGAMGHTYDEVAVICEVPIGTIRSRVARGRATLARTLGEMNASDVSSATDRENAGKPA